MAPSSDQQRHILGLVDDILMVGEYPELAKKVREAPLEKAREVLTEVEQHPGLEAVYFGAVAAAKMALLREDRYDLFWDRVRYIHGL